MNEIGQIPRVRLAHRVSVERIDRSTIRTTSLLTEVPIPRPEHGYVEHQVKCNVCGRTVTWTVFDVETTHERLRNLKIALAIGGVLLGGSLLAFLLMVLLAIFGVVSFAPALLLILIAAFLIGSVAVHFGGRKLAGEDGVSVSDPGLSNAHSPQFPSRSPSRMRR